MAISPLGSSPTLSAPVAQPVENEAAERMPDNEAAEAPKRLSLKEGQGTRIDLTV